ncbi:MAG: hypothetical protein IPJ87_17940 [Flavobacteriales bacterium]|nr:hypothetical protein [Flavobacteriales bacterium]
MQQLVALLVQGLVVQDLDVLDLLLEDAADGALRMVGPQRLQDQLVQVVLLRGEVPDEGLLGELPLERLLIVGALLVHRIEDPQVVLVARLEGAVQLEEALLALGEGADQVVQFGAGLHSSVGSQRMFSNVGILSAFNGHAIVGFRPVSFGR